jgi:malonate-semialdehyde dehydrogenase (acetylating)/methylmalonate-semialdehyde dehydrogenase
MEWRATSPLARARAVMALRDVDRHRDELAQLVTRDKGKTIDDAAADVGRGIESCKAAIGISPANASSSLPSSGARSQPA